MEEYNKKGLMDRSIRDICGYPNSICKCEELPDIIKCDGKDQTIKQTHGKAPLSNLLEFSLALEEVSRVREYGKTKYPNAKSWRQVPNEDLDSAILRHMFNKNKKDDETGYMHTAHMIMNLLFKLQKEMEDD